MRQAAPRSGGGDPLSRLAHRLPTPLGRLLEQEPVRYLLVAGSTTLGYLALVAGLLGLGVHYMVAIGIAQVTTIAAAFPAYRSMVFRSRGAWRTDLGRFLSVWSTGMVAGLVATPFLVEVLGVPPLLAQVVAIVVVAVGSYLGHRYVSFGRRAKAPSPTERASS